MQRQSILFVSIFAVLAGLATWTLRQPAERGMQRLRLGELHLSDKADRIDISGAHHVALHREGGVWLLGNGRAADAAAVQRALEELGALDSSDWISDEPARFEELGVEGPKATRVRLEGRANELVTLTIGGEPGPSEVLLRVGEQVFRGPPGFAMLLRRDEQDWLDRHLIAVQPEAVAQLEVALSGQAPYRLLQDGNGWQLDSSAAVPAGYRFDPAAASSLVSALLSSQLQDFVDTDPGAAATGLGEGEGDSWSWRGAAAADGQASQGRLRCGKARQDGNVYARLDGRDELFVLAPSHVAGLRRSRQDLRALNVMASLNFDDIVEAQIEPIGQKSMRFRKKEGSWALLSAKPTPSFVLDAVKLQARLRKLSLARAIGIAEAKQGKIGAGHGRLSVKTKDGVEHALLFGPAVAAQGLGQGFWAKGSADGQIYRISKPLHDELLAGAASLSKVNPAAQAAPIMPKGGVQGLDSLPPEVRENIQRQLAAQQQGQAG